MVLLSICQEKKTPAKFLLLILFWVCAVFPQEPEDTMRLSCLFMFVKWGRQLHPAFKADLLKKVKLLGRELGVGNWYFSTLQLFLMN